MLVWSLGTAKRRRRIAEDAAKSRTSVLRMKIAWAVVVLYNLVGVTDIYSTVLAIETGAGYEANPVVRAAMEGMGDGWIAAKLILQGVISVMVLWFPHWIVLSFFTVATAGNIWIVYNNLLIGGVF